MQKAIDSGALVLSTSGNVTDAVFAPDGQTFALVLDNQELVVQSLRDGQILDRSRAGLELYKPLFTPDGRQLRTFMYGRIVERSFSGGGSWRTLGSADSRFPATAARDALLGFDRERIYIDRRGSEPRFYPIPWPPGTQFPRPEPSSIETDDNLEFVLFNWNRYRADIVRMSDGAVFNFDHGVSLSPDGKRTMHQAGDGTPHLRTLGIDAPSLRNILPF